MRLDVRSSRRWLAIAALPLLVAGCSFSYSSEAISKSVSGSFESSSSSSPSGSESAYREDVRDYTYAWVRSSEHASGFDGGLAAVAKKHGISNWQADRATWVGVGEGLAKARVSQAELEAFKRSLSDGNADHMSAIESGYASYKAG
jgi:hypothetical protein